jgi:low density lipoprotein receptor-related protein 5/6
VLAAIGIVAMALPAEASKIFWLEPINLADPHSRVFRAELDGSNQELVLEVEGEANGMALDADNDRLYWSLWGEGILRGDADGCELLIPVISAPYGIALDLLAGKLYWTGIQPDELVRADLDGSSIEVLVSDLEQPRGLALDLAHGKVYWAEQFRVGRADFDGSNVETVADADAKDVAVDPEGGKVYWIEADPDRVRRADLDGSNVEGLVSLPPSFGYGPWGISLDLVAGKMYWASANLDAASEIGRANLDGSEQEIVLVLDSFRPALSLAVVPDGDGVSPFTCATGEVPALDKEAGALLALLLLVGSSFLLRR